MSSTCFEPEGSSPGTRFFETRRRHKK